MVSVEDIRLETGRDSAALQRQSRLHSIRCFRHCRNFVFYFELPDLCPVCNGDLLTTEVKVPPFVLKSPINTAVLGEPSVLIKPARGKSLLNDYHSGDNLHCGILDETGTVHDFDEDGLHTSSIWMNSIAVEIQAANRHRLPISQLIGQAKEEWLVSNPDYHSKTANCFSFLLWTLRHMGLYSDCTADQFITDIVLPKTREAARYISIYRSVVKAGGLFISDSGRPYHTTL